MDKEISKINAQKEKKYSNDESLKDPKTIKSKEIFLKNEEDLRVLSRPGMAIGRNLEDVQIFNLI